MVNQKDPVGAYIKNTPQEVQGTLESLRRVIKESAPMADETLIYGIPGYKFHGHLVGFALQRSHCSFFIMSPKLALSLKKEVTKTHELSGATIHFSPDNPLSRPLVQKIVRARVKENESKK